MAPPPGIVEVRCAGCGETLEVEHGLTEFACPDCGTPQALPPELMPRRPRRALPLPGRGAPLAAAAAAAPSRVACGGCGAVLGVPHGHGRFACPLCGAELAASPPAAVSIIEPPAAVPITRDRLTHPSEVCAGPSCQTTHAGQVQQPIHSEQTRGQRPEHSFSTFRADTGTDIPAVGRILNEPANPSSHREESHAEPVNEIISRPGKKKSGLASGPQSFCSWKVQREHSNQAIQSQEQMMPSKYSVHTDKAEGGLPNDTGTMHSKQKIGCVVVPGMIEDEQIKSLDQVVDEQHADEIPHNVVHVEQVQVDLPCKATGNSKKSAKDRKRNQKRKSTSLVNSSSELLHLRRSKRLSKVDLDLADTEPIQRIDASPNQNQCEAPQMERTLADADPSSPTCYPLPHGASNDLDDVDATTPPALSNGTQRVEQFPQSQMYSPETRWTLPVPSSNSWYDHEISQESFSGIDQCDRGYEEVRSNPSETQHQDMDGQLAQETCSDKNRLWQVQLKPHSKNLSENGWKKRNDFSASFLNDVEHPRDGSFFGTHDQINLSASCSRVGALLPVPAATALPITRTSSYLPHNCNGPTLLHQQPAALLYSQDASCGDVLQASISKSSKKRRGRAPEKLMEPRKEADRPVLTPSGTDWNVHPSCPKVTSTLSLLIKQNYPGTYVSVDTSGNGQPCEHVVYHWHQCPQATRTIILDEFLKRYKWSPGKEEECQKIFDRKAIRQLANLFCYEKQRVREDLAAKKDKKYLAVIRARGEMELEEDDGREDSDEQQVDDSMVTLEHDDPRKWKPFVPVWMKPKWWEMLCDHWAKDEVMKVSYQKRKNRNSGKRSCSTAGSRNVLTHQQLVGMDSGGKLVLDIDSPTKISSDKGEGEFVKQKACRTEDTTDQHTKETGGTQLGSRPLPGQVGNEKPVPKYSTGCVSKHGQQPMFTKEQVQQMINQALQGLNEVWEKKFLSLEKKMPSMASSQMVPAGAKDSLAVGKDKRCRLPRQDTFDSANGENDPSDRNDGENQDEEEHSS